MVASAVLDRVYASLSDETRRGILLNLSTGEKLVKDLAEPFSMSMPAISKHLKVLEGANLIRREVKGRTHVISLNVDSLDGAQEFITQLHAYWEKQLSSLETFLNQKETK